MLFPILNVILGILTIVAQVLILKLIFLIIFKKKVEEGKFGMIHKIAILRQGATLWLEKYALVFGFFIAIAGVVGSLLYSEVVGLTPCFLCWWQRIFIYPQVILFGIAMWKRDNSVWKYAIPLAVIAGLFALYHYIVQMTGSTSAFCDLGASCAAIDFLQFGYITIPLMSLTASVLVILLGVFVKRK